MKRRIVNSLKNFTSFDGPLDHQFVRLVEIYQVLHFFLKFDNSSALYIFFMIFKVIPEVSLFHLMAIFQVLLLIVKLNDKNYILLQPFYILNPQGFDGLKTLCDIT